MELSVALSDWVDWDVAAYHLGVALGAITPDVPFSKSKRVFWEDNPVGRGLHATLLALVDAGILEIRNRDEFRWVQEGFVNTYESPAGG